MGFIPSDPYHMDKIAKLPTKERSIYFIDFNHLNDKYESVTNLVLELKFNDKFYCKNHPKLIFL
jgi:hypothetical protein